MAIVKSVKIDGETIHIFNNAIYLFESSSGITLELDMIVSEVAIKKYRHEDNLIIEIELEDGRIINSIMHVKIFPGGLPQLSLFAELDDIKGYEDFNIVNENDSTFPKIDEGITLEEIRKVEMPNEDIRLLLKLPIDQIEWLKSKKKGELSDLFKDFINEYWRKQD